MLDGVGGRRRERRVCKRRVVMWVFPKYPFYEFRSYLHRHRTLFRIFDPTCIVSQFKPESPKSECFLPTSRFSRRNSIVDTSTSCPSRHVQIYISRSIQRSKSHTLTSTICLLLPLFLSPLLPTESHRRKKRTKNIQKKNSNQTQRHCAPTPSTEPIH